MANDKSKDQKPEVRKDSVERPSRKEGDLAHDHIKKRIEVTDWEKPPRPDPAPPKPKEEK
jgi:hypothetical protein